VTVGAASDYREQARRRLPRFLFDYLDGAANDELTARRRFLQALAHPRWTWDVAIRGRPLQLGNVAPLRGRAWVYALAADGERGVRNLLSIVEKEMRTAMALTGCTSVARLDRSYLAAVPRATE
jgi:isopentenyl diphosphate isomerase/L-lactate dehydrogenase-like FMN-dependent dehydrogenase